MRAWKCKQVIDFNNSTTTVKEERNKTLQQQTIDKYNRFQVVTKIQFFFHDNSVNLWRSSILHLDCWCWCLPTASVAVYPHPDSIPTSAALCTGDLRANFVTKPSKIVRFFFCKFLLVFDYHFCRQVCSICWSGQWGHQIFVCLLAK